MRTQAATLLVILALTAGCASNTGPAAAPSVQQPSSAPESAASASPSGSASPTGSGSPSAGGAQVLTGTVGQEGDPDGFVITLTDSSGTEVSSLPSGEYRIEIVDLSRIHNFRLQGPGLDQATSVPSVENVTWTVRLSPGEYTFLCDPHPQQMTGTLQVT